MKKKISQFKNCIFLVSCFTIFILLAVSCSKECTDVDTLYNAYYQATVYPENFTSYANSNQALFDADYESFLEGKIDEVNAEISNRYDDCDDTYGSGDFWHRCYEDVAAELGGFFGTLTAISEVTIDGRDYYNTDYGAYYILGKQMVGAEEYEYWISNTVVHLKDELTYEKCERKFFLFN